MLARGREAGEQDGKTRDEAPLLRVGDDGSKRVSLVPPGGTTAPHGLSLVVAPRLLPCLRHTEHMGWLLALVGREDALRQRICFLISSLCASNGPDDRHGMTCNAQSADPVRTCPDRHAPL